MPNGGALLGFSCMTGAGLVIDGGMIGGTKPGGAKLTA
jgi:hypothetical protein